MHEIERQRLILGEVADRPVVTVAQLVELTGASEATIRRDLKAMSAAGQVELVYGGATLPRRGNYTLRARQSKNVEAKRIIGKLAADLVENGSSLFLDSGTTCACMVPHLLSRRDLSIITNSSQIATQMGETEECSVLQLGGLFRFDRMDSVGPFAQMVIEQLSGYHAFIGADGLGVDTGLTSSNIETAQLYRVTIQRAKETTVLADSSKFAAPALYKIIDLGAVQRIVTDCRPSEEWQRRLESCGIELIVPAADDPAPSAV